MALRRLDAALLIRLLDAPDLAVRLRALPAPALRQLILEVGLEDAGELIALTSHEQLRDVFDEELWRAAAPGGDEAFDTERFALWLELLHEAGDAAAADRLARFSEEFLVFAFSRVMRVIDLAGAAAAAADADEASLLDKLVDAHGSQELDGLLIVARIETGWDALWSSLLALDERHGELARAILRRIALATEGEADAAGGLLGLLREDEMLAVDAAAEREDRRAERGFVSPADARAFLALARSAPESPELDPITRAYFRALEPARRSRDAESERRGAAAGQAWTAPAEGGDHLPVETARFRRALRELSQRDARAHQRVAEELVYLANVLVAGDASRAWDPLEAAGRAIALCEAGLDAAGAGGSEAALSALRQWGAVGLFRIAWAAEHSALVPRGLSSR